MTEILNFTIKGKQYKTEPAIVGRIIDLWKMKSAISMGSYGNIFRIALDSADEALLMIDIEAFLTVFCKQVLEDFKPRTIREMGIEDYLELKEVYQTQIEPWLKEIENLLKRRKEDNV